MDIEHVNFSTLDKYKVPLVIGGVIVIVFFLYGKKTVTDNKAANTGLGSFGPGSSQSGTGDSTGTTGGSSGGRNATDDAIKLLYAQEDVNNNAQLDQLAAYKDQFNFLFGDDAFVNKDASTASTAINGLTGINATPIIAGSGRWSNSSGTVQRPTGPSSAGTYNSNEYGTSIRNGDYVGNTGIPIHSVAGDSPYLSEALSGITGPNTVSIAQNRYGTSITLPTDAGVSPSLLAALQNIGFHSDAHSNAGLLLDYENAQSNGDTIRQALLTGQQGTIVEQLAGIASVTGLQAGGTNFEIQGTEFENAHRKPTGFNAFLDTLSKGVDVYTKATTGGLFGTKPAPIAAPKSVPTSGAKTA